MNQGSFSTYTTLLALCDVVTLYITRLYHTYIHGSLSLSYFSHANRHIFFTSYNQICNLFCVYFSPMNYVEE